jgi:hypothetical protein
MSLSVKRLDFAHHRSSSLRRGHTTSLADVEKFEAIHSSLTQFKSGNYRMVALEFFCQFTLIQASLFPHGYQARLDDLVEGRKR